MATVASSADTRSGRLRAFVWGWSAIAALALAISAMTAGSGALSGRAALLEGALLPLTVLAELVPVRIAPNQKASLASVPLLLMALLLPPPLAAGGAAAAILVGNLGARRTLRNAAFNAATATIAVLAAGTLASPLRLDGAGLGLGVVAAITFSALALAAPSAAAAIQRGESIPVRLWTTVGANWSQALAFDAIALSVAILGMLAPEAAPIPLLVLPLVLRMNVALEGQLAANEALHKVLSGQRRFLTDVSHNVGNPLATIRMNLSLLQHGASRYAHQVALADAGAEAARLSQLFQRLRLLAETDEDLPMKPSRLDLAEIANDLVRTYAGEAGQRGVELRWEATGIAEVDGDEDLLRQAVANLVENAVRHTPRGKMVRLRVGHSGTVARVEVIDEGSGIDPELLPDIFERFKKGPAGGSGLGLAIARNVIQRHGGEIMVETTVGAGSRFEIRLPGAVQ